MKYMKKKANILLVGSICIILSILIIIVVIMMYTKYKFDKQHSVNYFKSYHQYFKYSPTTNETSHGLLEMNKDIPRGKFLSYKDSYGSHILISQFGSKNKNFKCKGSCFCDDDLSLSFRRNSNTKSMTISGLVFLHNGLSVASANFLADSHFSSECNFMFSDSCYFVRSVVDECEEETSSVPLPSEDVAFKKVEKFACKGGCYNVHDTKILDDLYLVLGKDVEFDIVSRIFDLVKIFGDRYICNEMFLVEEITIDRSFDNYNLGSQLVESRRKFVQENLTKHCLKKSKKTIEMKSVDKEGTFSFCQSLDDVGHNTLTECNPIFKE